MRRPLVVLDDRVHRGPWGTSDSTEAWPAPSTKAAGESTRAPTVPFRRLTTLWVQLTGTWCNLECVHCINASGPGVPWLKPLDGESVRRAILAAERLGVKEIDFTGGGPFPHRQIPS